MKRLVYIFIFMLSLLLMCILSSCRSPKTVTMQKFSADSLTVQQKDSTGTKMNFSFDEMCIRYLQDSSTLASSKCTPSGEEVKGVKELVIRNGKFLIEKTNTNQSDSTSSNTKRDIESVKVRSGPTSLITCHLSLIILSTIFLAVIIVVYKIRSKVLK